MKQKAVLCKCWSRPSCTQSRVVQREIIAKHHGLWELWAGEHKCCGTHEGTHSKNFLGTRLQASIVAVNDEIIGTFFLVASTHTVGVAQAQAVHLIVSPPFIRVYIILNAGSVGAEGAIMRQFWRR